MPTLACTTLACTEAYHFEQILRSLQVYLILKPLSYFAFIQAFRFRVAGETPMSYPKAFGLAVVRAVLGLMVIGTSAYIASSIYDGLIVPSLPFGVTRQQIIIFVERVSIWAAIGFIGAHLRGRRLLGWTLSGAAIDIAYDFALEPALPNGMYPVWIITGVIAAFVIALTVVGHRRSLVAAYTPDPTKCRNCGYSLAGNVTGKCPECGVVRSAT